MSDISSKMAEKHKKCIFACFWAYVGQPHGHIGWATSMPFASFNYTNPRINPWNVWKKYWENLSFFELAILSLKKTFFFCFRHVKVYWLTRMGQNFDQVKRDNTFWHRPNILHSSVYIFWLSEMKRLENKEDLF